MAHVHPGTDGKIVLHLADGEDDVLEGLFDEMKMLLEADIPRTDAVMERLFPPAYDDVAENKAFDDLVHDELHEAKLEALRRARRDLEEMDGDHVVLDRESVEAWLRLLNDIRLAIGTRLEVDEEVMSSELEPDDPNAPALSAIHWLGWVQESMLRAIQEPGPNGGDQDVEAG